MNEEKELLRRVTEALIVWYRANRRVMPWRAEPTPYHVWISEIMLQQTRIEAVLPYYDRFLKTFPNLRSLAESDDDLLMKHWEGLGYYSRARHLKQAAVRIVSEYGGRLPESAAELRKLPGIGEYTAGAIASIAYGRPEPAVDGNVLRVIMRVIACSDDIMQPATRKAVSEALRAVYPSGEDASNLTQGIMELGETVCLPNAVPKCENCPVRSDCRAYALGKTLAYPVKSPKKERRIEQKTVLLLRCGNQYALCRRPEGGLLAGLWEFPNLNGKAGKAKVEAFLREKGISPLSVTPCGQAKHLFTHVEWKMT
ncbi:MAG: A/G-specific adenine glycosylase [Clostridia bacterium]|nr:A/G-specific adenine glycosylase [Clostridia bacterium]